MRRSRSPDDEDVDGNSHVEPHEDDADETVENIDGDAEEAPVECEGAVPVEAEKDAAEDKPAAAKPSKFARLLALRLAPCWM